MRGMKLLVMVIGGAQPACRKARIVVVTGVTTGVMVTVMVICDGGGGADLEQVEGGLAGEREHPARTAEVHLVARHKKAVVGLAVLLVGWLVGWLVG